MKTKIKLNVDFKGFKAGQIISVDFDKDIFWRKRLKDSKIDNCIEIYEKPKIENKKIEEDLQEKQTKTKKTGGKK
jgi:hypothetical protein